MPGGNTDNVYNTGDILVAGLGIGLILTSLLPNAGIKSVVVVEQSKDVVSLVVPRIASAYPSHMDKLRIIEGDIFDRSLVEGLQFDHIYFDIWPTICGDNWHEIKKLKRIYRRHLRKSGTGSITAWVEGQVAALDRSSRREERMHRMWGGYAFGDI